MNVFKKLTLKPSQDVNIDLLVRELLDLDYNYADMVAEGGDFSLRGGIIDIFPVDFAQPVRIELDGNRVESMRLLDPSDGTRKEEIDHLALIPLDSAKAVRARGIRTHLPVVSGIDSFFKIKKGDLVVHIDHGIGRFLGMRKLDLPGERQVARKNIHLDESEEGRGFVPGAEYLALKYADGDILYVPKRNSHLVRRYVGVEGCSPKLHKLGTNAWAKVKEKAADAVNDFAVELLQLQAARAALEGHAFSPDGEWQAEFEKRFPYEETPDQLVSTVQVKRDMESSKPMDRLICGDVGYGKTEVALRAAFKAVMDNKQVAMLVPTTILAEQHYRTFTERMKDFPVNIQALSRFKTQKEQGEIVEGLKKGSVDIVIGTHRLVSADVGFHELGLVIIDEEQRFGVRHKEKFKHYRMLVDVLTLTATPIPRTLYMSLVGLKDMSIVSTPPSARKPIRTQVIGFDEKTIAGAIRGELERNGQVYFVHNRVRTIERMARDVQRLVPEAKVAIVHGQMREAEIEMLMLRFVKGEVGVLVCSSIIESGLDIPNVNTIIVNRADAFGLSDLYQLRGRVGRFMKQAYAYFIVPGRDRLAGEALRRIEAIEKFTELGSGFKIATEDLEIRGSGNILGIEQSGYIAAVGFDLYCKMLKTAIKGHRP